jgi:predicted DNA-binding ribbon-helix-helix protein
MKGRVASDFPAGTLLAPGSAKLSAKAVQGPLESFATRGKQIMVSSTKSLIIQRSIAVAGRKTSVSMEQPFWDALKEIAQTHNQSLARIVTKIKEDREDSNLSSEIRLFVFDYFFHKKHEREDNRIQKILLAT